MRVRVTLMEGDQIRLVLDGNEYFLTQAEAARLHGPLGRILKHVRLNKQRARAGIPTRTWTKRTKRVELMNQQKSRKAKARWREIFRRIAHYKNFKPKAVLPMKEPTNANPSPQQSMDSAA